jgi:hypothetical protein
MNQDREAVHFRPRSSNGRAWVLGTAILTLMIFIVPLAVAQDEIPLLLIVFLLVVAVATTAPLFGVAWYSSSICYTITDDSLFLTMGRLMNDRIPLRSITRIESRPELQISLLASFRFPGLAVFDVDYIDVNRVRMLATSASKEILLIDTRTKRYGITPADEAAFLDALQHRLPDRSVIVSESEQVQ